MVIVGIFGDFEVAMNAASDGHVDISVCVDLDCEGSVIVNAFAKSPGNRRVVRDFLGDDTEVPDAETDGLAIFCETYAPGRHPFRITLLISGLTTGFQA